MARPSLSLWPVDPQTVQMPAGIRFESVHNLVGRHVRLHDHMNMIASHMRSPQPPTAVYADFAESIEDRRSPVFVKRIRRLVHLVSHHSNTVWTRFRQSATRNIVIPVDRTGFIAVKMSTIAGESNEVPHGGSERTAP